MTATARTVTTIACDAWTCRAEEVRVADAKATRSELREACGGDPGAEARAERVAEVTAYWRQHGAEALS